MTDAAGSDVVQRPGTWTQAIILTHNAPASLERCLAAVASQSDPPDAVMIVDMASDPVVDAASFELGIPIRVLRSDANLGPAGGWAMAFTDLLAGPYAYAWVMDDDIVPERECLANLWKESERHPQPPFVFPLSIQRDGSVEMHGSWCGFLIGKEIAAEVGVPNADLFWWAEDTEYTHWRIPQAGHPRQHAHSAIVHHDSVRRRESVPTWKYYYETRNMIYLHLHVMRSVGRFPLNFTMLLGRAFVRERSGYLDRMRAIFRGVVDGVRGRLGIRYPVTELHERP